jgi:hypothetical protein
MKRSLGKKFFFAIFGTFGSYVTNLRGTFVENVKKSKICLICLDYTVKKSEVATQKTYKQNYIKYVKKENCCLFVIVKLHVVFSENYFPNSEHYTFVHEFTVDLFPTKSNPDRFFQYLMFLKQMTNCGKYKDSQAEISINALL